MKKNMGEWDGEVTRVLKRVAATLGSGKFDEALRDLLHLSEKYPDAGEIRPQMAEGKLEDADRLLNEALEIDDRYGPTHETLGLLMLAWQEYAQAAKAFEEA